MSILKILDRMNPQPAVGVIAQENGMVRTPALQEASGVEIEADGKLTFQPEGSMVIDLGPNQSGILSKQYALIADRLGELDTLRKGLVSALDRIKTLEALATGQNDRIAALEDAEEGSHKQIQRLFNMVEDLAKENAELRGSVDILTGELRTQTGYIEGLKMRVVILWDEAPPSEDDRRIRRALERDYPLHDPSERPSTLELGHAEDHDLSDMEIPVQIKPKRER